MTRKKFLVATLLAACGVAIGAVSHTLADSSSDAPTAGEAPMQLPPGWTDADMQAMMAAATPGDMHKFLAEGVGNWHCKTTMWTSPDGEPITSEGTSEVTSLLDGRFTKCVMNGEMPGMGPYNGVSLYGFDNVSQKFVSVWIDNMSTGMMTGTGELSDDGKTLSWEFTGNCPIQKKMITVREIETITGPNTRTVEMFGTGPKGGPEFKMMQIEMTRK
jgi:hypothetical protein